MDQREDNHEVSPRTMDGGAWYWVQKAVMQDHAVDIRPIGIAVYNCLAAMADRNQECFPSQQYIADILGYSRATISKALKILERRNLITVRKKGRDCRVYRLLDARCKNLDGQMSTRGNSDVKQGDTNNTMVTRSNNNIVSVDKYGIPPSDTEETETQTREELLAADIAAGLEDPGRLPRYRTLAHRYPEHFLRRILSETKQVPDHRIRKSRAALFNHLLKKYVQGNNHDSGDQSRN